RAESNWGLGRFRRAPLAAHLLGMFALAEASAGFAAATWTVNTCSNDTTGTAQTGTLRYALTHATNGDTVDMTGLVCSTISLTEAGTTAGPLTLGTGLGMNVGTITVLGPGRDKLTITGNNLVRLVYHSSIYPSQLILKDLTLSHGHADYDLNSHGDGGCIYTSGSVTLDHVTMKDCYAHGKGGGINAFD